MVRTAASGSTRGNHATRNLRPPQPSNSQLDTSDASFGKRRDNNFLERLWSFISDEASAPVMAFSRNGKYLVAYNPDEIPAALASANICKHKDYQSFQRQMTIYGWRRIPQGELQKIVIDEDSGMLASMLPSTVKVMQHGHLVRDSPACAVKAIVRKAKPKGSRLRAENGTTAHLSQSTSTANPLKPLDPRVPVTTNGALKRKSGKDPVPLATAGPSSKRAIATTSNQLKPVYTESEEDRDSMNTGSLSEDLDDDQQRDEMDFEAYFAKHVNGSHDMHPSPHLGTMPELTYTSSYAPSGSTSYEHAPSLAVSVSYEPTFTFNTSAYEQTPSSATESHFFPPLPKGLQDAYMSLEQQQQHHLPTPYVTTAQSAPSAFAYESAHAHPGVDHTATAESAAYDSNAHPPTPVIHTAPPYHHNNSEYAVNGQTFAGPSHTGFNLPAGASDAATQHETVQPQLTHSVGPADCASLASAVSAYSLEHVAPQHVQSIPPPFYYQPPPGNHFHNPTDAPAKHLTPPFYSLYSSVVQNHGST